jgi:hypothetical protein
MLLGALAAVHAAMEAAQPEMAVRDQRPHSMRLGEPQGFVVVGLLALGIERIGMRRDVAEQMPRRAAWPG